MVFAVVIRVVRPCALISGFSGSGVGFPIAATQRYSGRGRSTTGGPGTGAGIILIIRRHVGRKIGLQILVCKDHGIVVLVRGGLRLILHQISRLELSLIGFDRVVALVNFIHDSVIQPNAAQIEILKPR